MRGGDLMKSAKWYMVVFAAALAFGIGVSGLMPAEIQARDIYSGCPSPACSMANFVMCTNGGCSPYFPYICNDCEEDEYFCHVVYYRWDYKYGICRRCLDTYGCYDKIPSGGPNIFIP